MPHAMRRLLLGVGASAAVFMFGLAAPPHSWADSSPVLGAAPLESPLVLTRNASERASPPTLEREVVATVRQPTPMRRTGAPPQLLEASHGGVASQAPATAEVDTGAVPSLTPLGTQDLVFEQPKSAAERSAPLELGDADMEDADMEVAAIRQRSAPVAAATRADLFAAALRQALSDAPRPISDFYAARGFQPIWAPRPAAVGALVETLAQADRHGLPPARYGVATLREGLEALGPDGLASGDVVLSAVFEAALSRAYLKYARDVGFGLVSPRDASPEIDRYRAPAPPSAEMLAAAATAAAANDMWRHLETLPPQTRDYRGLLAAFAEARASVPLATIEIDETLRPGMRSPVIATLRERLYVWGDASVEVGLAHDADYYDDGLAEAIRVFQRRSGLSDDGLVGRNTTAALNAASQASPAQLAVNLERARWMNRPLGERRVVVNIPDLHAELIDHGDVLLRTRVVVGEAGKHETPEFSDEMSHVVVNPFWHVPYSIASDKLLKELQRDPSFAYSQRFEIFTRDGGWVDPWFVDWHSFTRRNFPFRMRQLPGHNNALGDVKFIFPNEHAVYLHDTPAKQLFSRDRRDFSHGCIRVADPTALAELLLGAQSSDPEKLYARLRKRSGERHVALEEPVAVHLKYRTAWVDQEGVLQRRDDLYGRDPLVADALRRAGAYID